VSVALVVVAVIVGLALVVAAGVALVIYAHDRELRRNQGAQLLEAISKAARQRAAALPKPVHNPGMGLQGLTTPMKIMQFTAAEALQPGQLATLDGKGRAGAYTLEDPNREVVGIVKTVAAAGGPVNVELTEGAHVARQRFMVATGHTTKLGGFVRIVAGEQKVGRCSPDDRHILGVAMTDGRPGDLVEVLVGANSLNVAPPKALANLDEKSANAVRLWRIAIGEVALIRQKDVCTEAIALLAKGEIEENEGFALLARYGYALPPLEKAFQQVKDDHRGNRTLKDIPDERIVEASFITGNLTVTTTRATRRVDRDLDLYRREGIMPGEQLTPARLYVSGAIGQILDEADAALDAAFEDV
jgi:hypothetical protein